MSVQRQIQTSYYIVCASKYRRLGSGHGYNDIGACWKVLSAELDLNLTAAEIASATPCQTTLSYWLFNTAAESYLKVANMLKGKLYALSQDGAISVEAIISSKSSHSIIMVH
jgi:hypothetical protein